MTDELRAYMRKIGRRGGASTAKKHPDKLAMWGKRGGKKRKKAKKPAARLSTG